MASVQPLQMNWLQLHKRTAGPLGLKNFGNTCYLNSVLQCLTYTPPLANFCLSTNHSSSCSSIKDNNNSTCPFCLLEKRIARSLNMVDGAVDSPVRIHNCLYIFAKHFRDGRQEDAHEFLRYVIESCNNVCVKMHNKQLMSRSRVPGKHGDTKQEPHTVVKEIFGGAIQSQLKCLSCGAESNKTDDIMDLSLDILQISSVKEAMSRYFQPEILDGNNKYRCDKCKKLSAARKQMSMFRTPNVLVIQLKRFENIYGGKIDRFISFEEHLELAAHMCRPSQDPRPEYALYGVIVHAGYSQESGHYYSFVKDPGGKWFCCNDAHVTPANSQSVLSEKAYILFYVRSNAKLKVSKDRVASQNGHGQNPGGTSMRKSAELQTPVSKDKFIEGKTNSENAFSSHADRGQTRSQLKFNIAKVPNGQARRPLVNENGTMLNGQAMGHGQTKLHPLSTLSNDKVRPGQEGTIQIEVQMDNGKHMQSPVVTRHDSLMEMSDIDTSTSYLKESTFYKANTVRTAARSPSQDERNLNPNVASCCSMVQGNGHIVSIENGNEMQHTTEFASRQQDSFQFSGDGKNEACSVEAQEDLLEPKGNGTLDGPKLSAKRAKLESHQRDSSELEIFKLRLEKEGREWLQCSGWCETLRNSLRTAKRRRPLQKAQPSNLQGKEERRELILAVQESMRKQVPYELKGYLFKQLQAFFTEKHCNK